ncbi:MAG: hypothetical protein N3B16_07525 [Candidatus Aminicenantes bacterium]|nr:hypothetical protein [Candidatus Aminicenantes bacterium]
MAHFLLKHKSIHSNEPESFLFSNLRNIQLSQNWMLFISGSNTTYDYYEKDGNFICAIGYVCNSDSYSMKDTLSECLIRFEEKNLVSFKKELLGQFIIIIKKNSSVFIFDDFIGGRNIFYNSEGNLVTSSFAWAEESIGFGYDFLNYYKTLEYLALREVKYPAWLGQQTMNKKINWLLPYEYIKFNINQENFEVKRILFEIDNIKESNLNILSEKLIQNLSRVIERKEFLNSKIGCSLTGGRDSRLVATLAANIFPKCRYRTAISKSNIKSLKDLKVAKKISRINRIKLDIYEFTLSTHEKLFRTLTEDMIPAYNITITPLIINNNNYALTLGGIFGSEIFEPILVKLIATYNQVIAARIKKSIASNNQFIDQLMESITGQFTDIKRHYHLKEADERDYIRIFQLLITARYSSFITAAMAQFGYDLEPYGSYPLVELALQIDSSLWGYKKSLAGDATVQKVSLYKISRAASRVLAYSSYRPVMPFCLRSSPKYLWGYFLHINDWITRKISDVTQSRQKLSIPGFNYASDGWYEYYLNRIDKYKAINHSIQ